MNIRHLVAILFSFILTVNATAQTTAKTAVTTVELGNGWDAVIRTLSAPAKSKLPPTLYLADSRGARLADGLTANDPGRIEKQMARLAILASYNGPVTLYDLSGADPAVKDYADWAMDLRKTNPAMQRGRAEYFKQDVGDARTLTVRKLDPVTGNEVLIVFSDRDTTVPVHGYGAVDVDAWRPEIIVIK